MSKRTERYQVVVMDGITRETESGYASPDVEEIRTFERYKDAKAFYREMRAANKIVHFYRGDELVIFKEDLR